MANDVAGAWWDRGGSTDAGLSDGVTGHGPLNCFIAGRSRPHRSAHQETRHHGIARRPAKTRAARRRLCSMPSSSAIPNLVLAQCKAGIVGSFPALNARPAELLDEWLTQIQARLAEHRG